MVWPWLSRLWRPQQPSRTELGALATGAARRVEIEGRVEALAVLRDPLSGDPCVAVEYRAWPPATTIGMDGATAHAGRAYQVNAWQAVDFVLVGDGVRVLVRPEPGEDVGALHQSLLDRYGVGLRAESERLEAGQTVQVVGEVVHRSGGAGTPHRELPYAAIVRVEQLRSS